MFQTTKVQPPSDDKIWDWAAWLAAAAWLSLVDWMRRAHKARKALSDRVEEQGRQIEGHLDDCQKYRQSVAAMAAKLDEIYRILVEKALGLRE